MQNFPELFPDMTVSPPNPVEIKRQGTGSNFASKFIMNGKFVGSLEIEFTINRVFPNNQVLGYRVKIKRSSRDEMNNILRKIKRDSAPVLDSRRNANITHPHIKLMGNQRTLNQTSNRAYVAPIV